MSKVRKGWEKASPVPNFLLNDPALDAILKLVGDEETEKRIVMNYKKEKLNKAGLVLKFVYLPSLERYSMRIPAQVRKKFTDAPQKVYGKTEEELTDRLFQIFCLDDVQTLETLFEAWKKQREADPDVAFETVRKNQCDWNKFITVSKIASVPVASLTAVQMAEYYRGLTAGRGMKKKAFNNVRSIINALLDKAVAEGYCEQNVSRLVNTAGYKYKPTNNSMKVYSSEERDLILGDLRNSDNIYDAAVSMMFCLGCRVSEVKALKWRDIDWAKSTVYICRELVNGPEGQVEKNHTKSGMTEGNRSVPLSERALEILSSIPRTKDEDQYIFQKDLKPLRTESINTHLRDICRKLGIEYLSSHKIRAWAITEMVKSGVDEATIMYAAGHASRQTMQSYIRLGKIQMDADKVRAVFS